MAQSRPAGTGGFYIPAPGPPPYAPRDQAPGQAAPPPNPPPANTGLEFSETSAVTLTWNLTGLSQLYAGSVGEAKSKCIKSAIFGDADNLWEVLFYCNSGIAGGEYSSLYLSCVPTQQERDASIGTKWSRRGLWWFRFEIRSSVPDERGKPVVLATKDASDHTFAVKTANWGWQQFAKRDVLFKNPLAAATDSFVIACTIQAQPQPPAGYWLGMGIPPSLDVRASETQTLPSAMRTENGPSTRHVGSGGGLSAWSGGQGASGGVAGGTTAGAGVKRVVPRELVTAVGSMLDDELYSDIEFVIPPARSHKHPSTARSASPRKIYANKKLLGRYDYFRAMFSGGFASSGEASSSIETDDGNVYDRDEFDASEDDETHGHDTDDDFDSFSDSDAEDEAAEYGHATLGDDVGEIEGDEMSIEGAKDGKRKLSIGADTTATSAGNGGSLGLQTGSGAEHEHDEAGDGESTTSEDGTHGEDGASSPLFETHESSSSQEDDTMTGEEGSSAAAPPGGTTARTQLTPKARALGLGRGGSAKRKDTKAKAGVKRTGPVMGPKKTRVVVRDAAWSTWWALLYWIYTDTIHFAPLTSTFTHPANGSAAPGNDASNPASAGGALGLSGSGAGGASGNSGGAPGGNTAPRASTSHAGPHFATRAEWIQAWLADHGSRDPDAVTGTGAHILPVSFTDTPYGPCPRPVSAKAIYRLADKLDIPALKLRAFQHIMSQMNAANVPAEVFSRFSSTFEDVRKVQVAFFLKHWGEIKKSETMMQIWQQIRHGKHIGFEEVWPLIVGQLDFKPS